MIAVYQKKKPIYLTAEDIEEMKPKDIIVKRLEMVTEETEEGFQIKKPTYYKINITQKVNETKKLVKVNKAQETIKKLDEILRGV